MNFENVGSIDSLVEAYQKLKNEDFDGIKRVRYSNAKATFDIVVDKKSEVIEKLKSLGINEFWDDCAYFYADQIYRPATFVITDASMDEADELISALAQKQLRVQCVFNEPYSNSPVKLPDGCYRDIGATNVEGGFLAEKTQSLHIDEFNEVPARIVHKLIIPKFVLCNIWNLDGSPILEKEIKENRAQFDRVSMWTLFSELYPKVDQNLQSSPDLDRRSLYHSAEVVHVKNTPKKAKATGLEPWMEVLKKELCPLPPDSLSNAKPDLAVTTSLVWNVANIDFEKKTLTATVIYEFKNLKKGNDTLDMDTKGVLITEVKVNEALVLHTIHEKEKIADHLAIPIPSNKTRGTVSITYSTTPGGSGAFWIPKEYTAGGIHPMLYTLFCPTDGAGVIPGQHTPQVRLERFTLNVNTGNPDLMVLSSVSNNPTGKSVDGKYEGLHMGRSMPLYLVSLLVGDFAYHEFDGRTGVYAEQPMIGQAAKVFDELPKFLASSEEICGPYNWERYTPVILSKGFPFMAMEHPCASACGAICLEQPHVVIHELAHSWFGNDITNCTWQQFFWNEGFTCFIEYLVTSQIYGKDNADIEFLNLYEEARDAAEEFGETKPDVLKLCSETLDFEFTRIPYAKGAQFFFMLQKAIGEEAFIQFIEDYMAVFAENTMSDERFLVFLRKWLEHNMKGVDPSQFIESHQVHQWLYGSEMVEPDNKPSQLESIMQQVDNVLNDKPINSFDWDAGTTLLFFHKLKRSATPEQLQKLDQVMNYTNSDSLSILGGWAQLCGNAGYFTPKIEEMTVKFLITRNSYHQANLIAAALCKHERGRALASTILEVEKAGTYGHLFPLVRGAVESKLKAANSN